MSYIVSIIIPVYNVEPYIKACLYSVANQTMTEDVECILIDDCGTDNSLHIINSFIGHYHGNISFTLLRQEVNSGPSAARNSGLKVAKGEYICFLDSDDELALNAIEMMISLIRKYPRVDMVQGRWGIYKSKKFPEYTNDRRVIKESFLRYDGPSLSMHNRLIRRDLLLKYNLFFREDISTHEDVHWAFFLSKYVENMALCADTIYYHRYNPNSITHKINVDNEIKAYRIIMEDFTANIDIMLPGVQKGFILDVLHNILCDCYYNSEKEMRKIMMSFTQVNTFFERVLLKSYYITRRSFLLNMLKHLYKHEN